MLKVIENATLKIVQAMEKNRNTYNEAADYYRDTGYDRYYNKMERLDREYEELKAFIGSEEKELLENENTQQYKEIKELKRLITEIKSLVTYIHADYWSNPQVERLHEKLKDFDSSN